MHGKCETVKKALFTLALVLIEQQLETVKDTFLKKILLFFSPKYKLLHSVHVAKRQHFPCDSNS